MTNIATKSPPARPGTDALNRGETGLLARRIGEEGPTFPAVPAARLDRLPRSAPASVMACDVSCTICPVFNLLCGGAKEGALGGEGRPAGFAGSATVHTIPARRLILHPKEWSDFVPVICSGWAMSSVALPDGRRQIISFLLPGDIVSAGSLLAPLSGHTVEAITEVTYRKFKRDEIKGLLFSRADLLEKLFALWNEAKSRADQLALALDLGRRRADERIARLILRLADKVGKRSLVHTQTFDFPLRQRHIADATGLTPVHVSKVLGELQRAGLIDISSRSLTILNAAELQRVADGR
ncbi:MAG: Crp/Fnr family transcriptional regulator [Pseudolabrys sp.]|nr:Crp/Fnr family transcriptional regulator [Pseudolabrys sp.]MDP2298754.1 Crp/Fnr family transcriptional regulator [Pseudolabrys sp.]